MILFEYILKNIYRIRRDFEGYTVHVLYEISYKISRIAE